MHAIAATGGGFLLAVLWFDLMFDIQARGRAVSPAALGSIAAYYRRVTTEARPMNWLVSLVMLVTLLALAAEIVENRNPIWLEAVSLVAALAPMGLAMFRTVRNAVRLGTGGDSIDLQSSLAQSIYRDHVFCLASIAVLIGLQLVAQ